MIQRRSFAIHLGWLLVVSALLLSGPMLELAVFPTGTIVGTARRASALMVVRILLACAGAYLLSVRPRITSIHLTAWAVASVTAAAAVAALLQLVYVPPPIVSGWRSFAPASEHNQLGYRGRPIISYRPDDYVIVLLGDSQVEGYGLGFDAIPERLLESHLFRAGKRTRVVTIGAGGYGQDQELLALQEYFTKHRANLVVLWETPTNDIWNNVFKTHMASRNPKPTFWLDESRRLRGPGETLGEPLANSRIVVVSLLQRAFGLPWRDKSWERRLPEPYVPMRQYEGQVNTEWQDRWNTNLGRMRDEDLDTEKSHLAVMLTPRSKRMQYGLDLTRALIQQIEEVVTANQAHLVVMQVTTGDVVVHQEEGAREEDETVYVLNGKYYRTSNRQFHKNWQYVNKGFDLQIIPVTVRDWRIGPEDGHLNARAMDEAMAHLADRLVSRIGR
jgi:hypothetical protein